MSIGGGPEEYVITGTSGARRAILTRVAALLAVLLAALTLLTACAPTLSRPSPTVTYTPVPDAELYRRIAALPHVTKVDIGYADDFPNGSRYGGAMYTDGRENPYLILDQTIAILRQGVLRAHLSFALYYPCPDGSECVMNAGSFLSPDERDRRYGPQPGSGTPPASPPVPTPTDWTPPARPASSPPAST